MNSEQTQKSKSSYVVYMVLGALYVLVKVGFVSAGYLHLGAILHGLIPAVVTIVVCLLAQRALKQSAALLWHRIMLLAPLLIIITTPVYMYVREREAWLTNGRLEVLIIYEIMAIAQVFISLRQLKTVRD